MWYACGRERERERGRAKATRQACRGYIHPARYGQRYLTYLFLVTWYLPQVPTYTNISYTFYIGSQAQWVAYMYLTGFKRGLARIKKVPTQAPPFLSTYTGSYKQNNVFFSGPVTGVFRQRASPHWHPNHPKRFPVQGTKNCDRRTSICAPESLSSIYQIRYVPTPLGTSPYVPHFHPRNQAGRTAHQHRPSPTEPDQTHHHNWHGMRGTTSERQSRKEQADRATHKREEIDFRDNSET